MSELMRGLLLGCLLLAMGSAGAQNSKQEDDWEDPFIEKPWEEAQVELPPFPKDVDFYDFYVSPTASSRFFVDRETVQVGADGVVRYVLLVLSPSGVRNLSFEGMRCQTRERRIYATGRTDGSWSKSRDERWVPVREAVTNRHHAALFTDYFCLDGVLNHDHEDIRRRLKREGRALVD